ncbi:PREDICTED: thylakoid lumenal 17.9 kDa protein, chloroplastic isoform X2 [Nicotiana attenuata]|uniref:thylakoid lumenal 17.9 kDa protein, chloroplastic isoform X2 n=1 Tax=Nicotiana attenuata TaxID=49451 RepID=UPI0009047BBA|nr:PREDICTED: thylakoid lumenal 17.9 kDa protein, chloroplastic isoform X2 [Nicotiana attenuata]
MAAFGMSGQLLPLLPKVAAKHNSPAKKYSCTLNVAAEHHQSVATVPYFWSKVLPLAVAVSLVSTPLSSSAIPFLDSKSSSLAPTTPFSQSKNLPTGLENGKIRPCPSVNPGCVSTNPQSSSSAFPWMIPQNSTGNAIMDAILKTQKNAKIQVIEDIPDGKYLQAEVDGGLGRDVLEFLVKGDSVAYRAMATKVTYIYPFTTALGDSKGQEERMKKITEELGWYAPSLDSME